MSSDFTFTKENLDNCLRELGKEFRKLNGTAMKAEITLIGGAAILANYGFRDSTYDVDAIIQASSAMKDAVNRVGDKMGLPNGWLNADFTRTSSYSPKLTTFSTYYKTFSHVLTVRTISGAYLVAMKLMAGRQYKNDISDIVGILQEQEDRGQPLTIEQIRQAVKNLYGGWEMLPQGSQALLEQIWEDSKTGEAYQIYREQERLAKESLMEFEQEYSGAAKEENVEDILRALKKKKGQEK